MLEVATMAHSAQLQKHHRHQQPMKHNSQVQNRQLRRRRHRRQHPLADLVPFRQLNRPTMRQRADTISTKTRAIAATATRLPRDLQPLRSVMENHHL